MTSLFYIKNLVRIFFLITKINKFSVCLRCTSNLTRISSFENMVEPLILIEKNFLFPPTPYFILPSNNSPLPVCIIADCTICIFSEIFLVISYRHCHLRCFVLCFLCSFLLKNLGSFLPRSVERREGVPLVYLPKHISSYING